jgi:hypothetical protein
MNCHRDLTCFVATEAQVKRTTCNVFMGQVKEADPVDEGAAGQRGKMGRLPIIAKTEENLLCRSSERNWSPCCFSRMRIGLVVTDPI